VRTRQPNKAPVIQAMVGAYLSPQPNWSRRTSHHKQGQQKAVPYTRESGFEKTTNSHAQNLII